MGAAQGDFRCRLGDEFTVILETSSPWHSAVEVVTADRTPPGTHSIGEHSLHVGVSAGIVFPEQTGRPC